MKVDVVVNGRPWNVAVEPADGSTRVRVTIKSVSRIVDASWIDPDTLSLVDAGTAHEVRFHRRDDNGAVGVQIGGTLHEATILRRGREGVSLSSRGKNPPEPFAAGGGHAVKSPMPGRVVRVLVGIGDQVAARQGVVVVEAMKMENELRTPIAGRVKEIAVVPGTAVETGAVLVVVDQS